MQIFLKEYTGFIMSMALTSVVLYFVIGFGLYKIGGIRRNRKRTDHELQKLSAYECGYEPFARSSSQVDISFLGTGILFLIFDVELLYVVPWASSYMEIGFLGFISFIVF